MKYHVKFQFLFAVIQRQCFFCGFYCYLYFTFVFIILYIDYSLQPCDHLLGKDDLLALLSSCVFCTLSSGVSGQVVSVSGH